MRRRIMERLSIVICLCLLYPCLFGIVASQEAQFPCTEKGVFEIDDGTCQNYYICVSNGVTLVPAVVSCDISTIFVQEEGRCVSRDMATCLQTTTAPPTTVAPPCPRYGRFPIPDPNCKRYYLCYWDGTGYTMMDNLTCPNTLLFEPISEKCVPPARYTCPGLTG